MITNLSIPDHNKQAHIDIEKELLRHQNTWFHFEIRCSNGNIVDFVTREYVTYENLEPKQEPTPHDR
jgi:hypothetical protein